MRPPSSFKLQYLKSKLPLVLVLQIKKEGGSETITQLKEVKQHVLSFPAYESHYACSQTKKKCLPRKLNIATMYKLYKNQCQNKPICLTKYTKIFKAENISFGNSKLTTAVCMIP